MEELHCPVVTHDGAIQYDPLYCTVTAPPQSQRHSISKARHSAPRA